MHVRLTIFATLFCLTSSAAASGKVFVVSPSGPFTQIHPAVDAASDDDVVLVATGNYAGFSIIDKSVSVVANAGANVAVAGPVSIGHLASNRDVALVSLSISFSTSSLSDALTLRNNAGAVRLDNCIVNGANSGSGISNGTGAVEVRHSPDLALNNARWEVGTGRCIPAEGCS
jgi:hypothetical protein